MLDDDDPDRAPGRSKRGGKTRAGQGRAESRSGARTERPPPKPLDAAALERLALRYVERFATTRGRLADYLKRKIREIGWDGAPADPAELAQRMADLGYIDDRAFAEQRAAAMQRRGLGARRVAGAFREAGIDEGDAASVSPIARSSPHSPLRVASESALTAAVTAIASCTRNSSGR
jgi:regulatory protein